MLEIEQMEAMDVGNIENQSPKNANKPNSQKEKQSDLVSFGSVDKTKFTLLDKLINDYGYGWEVNKIIFSAFLCFILNGYLTTSYCSFMLGFKKKFDLNNNQISLIGMGFCLSKFVTNFSIGFLTNLLGRMFVLKFALIFTFICNLLISLFLFLFLVLF